MLQLVNSALGETVERLALQGGCWKRIAQAQARIPADGSPESAMAATEVDAALAKMAECYDRAVEKKTGDDSYPRLMACDARICDAVRKGTEGDDHLRQDLAELKKVTPFDDPDFWQLIRLADLRMNEAILQANDPASEIAELNGIYLRAYEYIGSPVKLASVFEQLDFYEDIFANGSPGTEPKRASIVALARNLRDNLRAAVSGQSTARQNPPMSREQRRSPSAPVGLPKSSPVERPGA